MAFYGNTPGYCTEARAIFSQLRASAWDDSTVETIIREGEVICANFENQTPTPDSAAFRIHANPHPLAPRAGTDHHRGRRPCRCQTDNSVDLFIKGIERIKMRENPDSPCRGSG